jgi:hypothetical protein
LHIVSAGDRLRYDPKIALPVVHLVIAIPDIVPATLRRQIGRAIMKLPKNLGMLLLAVWLILFGLLTAPLLKVSFAYSGDLLAVLAVAAGVLLLLQR